MGSATNGLCLLESQWVTSRNSSHWDWGCIACTCLWPTPWQVTIHQELEIPMFKPRLYLPSRVSCITDVYALDLRERKEKTIFANGFSLLLSAFSGSFLFILPGPNYLALTVLTFGFSSFKGLWASLNGRFCYRFSVASALHSDSHDRYERLTSVSSSVDFDQRDNVSGSK